MKLSKHIFTRFCILSLGLSSIATAGKPTLPYTNPHLAASTYPMIHTSAAFSPLAGPTGPSRRLQADEIQWKPIGPINMYAPIYSAPYPNGKRVLWIGGYDRVAKLDADTLQTLTTQAFNDNTFLDVKTIEQHINTIDKLDDQAFVEHNLKVWPPIFKHAISAYRLLSKDGEFYLLHRAPDNSISLRVYGETDATDPSSAIELRREWKIPPAVSKAIPYSVNMTSDGQLVIAMSDGILIALSTDFNAYSVLQLPRQVNGADPATGRDIFSTFIRNGIVTDDTGGIFVVTRDNMHRVQWTGEKLSLNENDGAWSATYPNELGIGSGTTPALMGWGDEDHLVVITDASKSNRLMAFWRDGIPDDWDGLPNTDRRVAGVLPISFGGDSKRNVLIENTPVVYGYGVFFNNTKPVKSMPDQGGATQQWLAESFSMHVPGHEARGGTMIQWNPKTRNFKSVWQSQTNFVSTVCSVSGATETIYCWGSRDREWTLEGTNWHTGESTFHYTLGKSHRFNPLGGLIIVAPNGAIDCGCVGGFGMVRVQPKE